MKIKEHFTAVFEEASEGGYVAYIEELPGVNTQGETLEEARANLQDALLLIIEVQREIAAERQSPKTIKEPLQLVA